MRHDIRITEWVSHMDQTKTIEVGNRDSAIRIVWHYFEVDPLFRNEDLFGLWDYLHQSGRVSKITANVATQTIQYLKETA